MIRWLSRSENRVWSTREKRGIGRGCERWLCGCFGDLHQRVVDDFGQMFFDRLLGFENRQSGDFYAAPFGAECDRARGLDTVNVGDWSVGGRIRYLDNDCIARLQLSDLARLRRGGVSG